MARKVRSWFTRLNGRPPAVQLTARGGVNAPGDQVADAIRDGDDARAVGDWIAAAGHYGAALRANPGLADIWVQRGHALKELGDLRGGEASYRRALALEPKSFDTHLQLGHVLKLQGRIQAAAEAYLQALVIDGRCDDARTELQLLGYLDGGIAAAVQSAVLPLAPPVPLQATPTWNRVAQQLERIEVEGGWLYRTSIQSGSGASGLAMAFVPGRH